MKIAMGGGGFPKPAYAKKAADGGNRNQRDGQLPKQITGEPHAQAGRAAAFGAVVVVRMAQMRGNGSDGKHKSGGNAYTQNRRERFFNRVRRAIVLTRRAITHYRLPACPFHFWRQVSHFP
jgi:hypothetical protein